MTQLRKTYLPLKRGVTYDMCGRGREAMHMSRRLIDIIFIPRVSIIFVQLSFNLFENLKQVIKNPLIALQSRFPNFIW